MRPLQIAHHNSSLSLVGYQLYETVSNSSHPIPDSLESSGITVSIFLFYGWYRRTRVRIVGARVSVRSFVHERAED